MTRPQVSEYMTRSAERKGNYECVANSREEVVFQLEG